MTTEEAIDLWREGVGPVGVHPQYLLLTSDRERALRHLIAEARKVERVRDKYATLEHQESVECPDAGELWAEGFEEAWEDVMLIIDAGDGEEEDGEE